MQRHLLAARGPPRRRPLDARHKDDVEPLGDVLSKLEAINGVTYRRSDPQGDPAERQVGLLAQEVQAAFPELVQADARGHLSVAYGRFTAVLLTAIQEQQREIESLRERLAEPEDRLARQR